MISLFDLMGGRGAMTRRRPIPDLRRRDFSTPVFFNGFGILGPLRAQAPSKNAPDRTRVGWSHGTCYEEHH
eukprot:8820474-Pyramimonas_sp.AAC.1